MINLREVIESAKISYEHGADKSGDLLLDKVVAELDHYAPLVFLWESTYTAKVGDLEFTKGTGLYYKTREAAVSEMSGEPARHMAVFTSGHYRLVGHRIPYVRP